jgi:choloylglycine hydrolase
MCTNFKVLAKTNGHNSNVVIGRSMEFALFMDAKLYFRKANQDFKQCLYDPYTNKKASEDLADKFQFEWHGKYGFVAMNAFNQEIATDGINTEGLYVGTLQLNCSEYQVVTDPLKGLSFLNFCNWVLSSFKTCKEVREALELKEVQIGNGISGPLGQHFAIHDKDGKSLVVEVVKGEINIYDNNEYGILTNDPVFPWQVENLKTYIAINPFTVNSAHVGNFKNTIETLSQGSGFSNIPGNQLPSARFVRAGMMVNYSLLKEEHGLDNAVNLATHILNTVDIPYGVVRGKEENGKFDSDYTLWTSVSDLTKKVYTIRLYESPVPYSIDLDKIDLEKLDGKQIEIPTKPLSINLTDKLNSMHCDD